MEHFRDRVAVVTGGASGIGRALVLELGRRGAIVTVADLDLAGAEAATREVVAAGGRAFAARVDVASADEVRDLVATLLRREGRIDFLFNNAGVGVLGEERDMTPELWRRVAEVNFWGVVHGVAAAYPAMIAQGSGHIVNTASLAGLVPVPMQAAYVATKYAVVGLSKALRAEAAGLGVRVSAVCPGLVRTPIFDAAVVLRVDRKQLEPRLKFTVVPPEEAARIILRGVARNRGLIVFPFDARLLWRIERFLPALSAWFWRRAAAEFRTLRADR